MKMNLKTLVDLAIEKDVDFEVWHGVTTHADKRTRAHMLISPADAPPVLVTFGDKKHGQLVSRVSLSQNKNIAMKPDDLVEVMETNSSQNQWRRTITENTSLFNLQFKDNKLVVNGTLKKVGDRHYELTSRNFVRVGNNPNIEESEPTVIHVILSEGVDEPTESGQVSVKGEYRYPDKVLAETITKH